MDSIHEMNKHVSNIYNKENLQKKMKEIREIIMQKQYELKNLEKQYEKIKISLY